MSAAFQGNLKRRGFFLNGQQVTELESGKADFPESFVTDGRRNMTAMGSASEPIFEEDNRHYFIDAGKINVLNFQ